MKLIALDVGTKRIGVAKADSNVRIAVPYAAVEVDGTEFKKIASLARAWDINCFVIGLPRNSAGEETKQSEYVRDFAKKLKHAIPTAKICFQDESLTSVEAEKRLKGRKKNYKKGDIDSEAATIILQDFLEEKMGKKTTTKAASARRTSVKAKKTHHIWTAIIAILVVLGLAGGGAYFYYDQGLKAVNDSCKGNDCKAISFKIASGSSVSNIADDLKSAGLIRSTLVFQVYYRLNFRDATIKIGEYSLNDGMNVEELLKAIVEGDSDDVFRLTFVPGDTLRGFKKELVKHGYREEEIDEALKADYSTEEFAWIFDGKPAEAGLEGYLYGETYEFYNHETVENIIKTMLAEEAKVLEENGLKDGFSSHGLNLYQGITLASIVQKEADKPEDQAKVAQVFYNRLENNISLGSDVTVQYALDLVDPDRQTYTDNAEALKIDSPYNTRIYPGLPYGPISNPGLSALKAVATPDESMANMLFFLTGDGGIMYYSDTEEGHIRNREEYCKEYCNIPL